VDTLLTTDQVADHLGVTHRTVLTWLSRGELRGIRLGRTRAGWRVSEADLQQFLATRANRPRATETQP
jgi:excisionase family DNA binding protein